MRALTIDDLDLSVYIKKGDEVEEDCSCDSTFMLATMDEVGRDIRSYFFWVPVTTVIYLIIDIAGGHGKNDAIDNTMSYYFECSKCNCYIKFLTHLKRICSTYECGERCSRSLRSFISVAIMMQIIWTKLCNKHGFNS